jgi:cbb3-type cytochrome oxidase maturation protein
MSFLWITIPATLLLAGALLALALRSVLRGDLDDPEGPAVRLHLDDDRAPERADPGTSSADPRARG